MKHFSMLIKPASSNCNLKCRYCFYNDIANKRDIKNYGIMSFDTTKALIDNVLESFNEKTNISFAFQGGEPMYAGLNYFQQFVDHVNKVKKRYHHISYSLQTNGTLLNDEWISFLRKNSFLVGISLDGFESNNDHYRGKGTFRKIIDAIDKLKMANIDFNILTVLTSDLASKPDQLYDFYKKRSLNNIQLIPCLPPLNETSDDQLTPQSFYFFYRRFFDRWFDDLLKGHYISVMFFDDLVRIFKGLLPYQCGAFGFCSNQFVIEADGSVYPCDFYVLDKYRIGNITTDSIYSLANNEKVEEFINESRRSCKLCDDCEFKNICNRQCKRLNISYFDDDYCGLQLFLKDKHQKLLEASIILR
ncbi:MAG: SPASM domain-containing protein [Erysipelotrichaceae bacterium]|nr:SPASM domain-containing protein [Erysipelotrichaceae bacterium]